MTNEHDDLSEIRELLGAYSLDAVDEFERARLDKFVADDAEAQQAVARYESALAELFGDDFAVAPPDHVWTSIRRRLRDTARPQAKVTMRTGRWLAAAAAVLLVAGGAVAWSRVGNSPSRTAQLATALADRDAGTGTLAGPGVQARVAIRPDGRGYLDTRTLPALPAGKVYQLWSLDAPTPLSLGVVHPSGGVATFTAATTSHTLALSVESEPGAAQPSLPPAATVGLTPIRQHGGP